jgi:hypothetical protein
MAEKGFESRTMKRYVAGLTLASAFVLAACATLMSGSPSGAAGISARGAWGVIDRALTGPLYEGDGGEGLRLAVLAPEAQGEVPEYLPMYIQGLLNSNLQRHSALRLVDRQNLEKIIAEQDLAAGGRFSDADFVNIGNLTNAQYFLVGTIQQLSGGQYALHLSVTASSSGEQRATFSGTGNLARLEGNGGLINEASVDLLSQLGVRLTEAGRASLLGGNMFQARAESALARGAVAETSGFQVEALLNYSQAASFDPSQIEALARLGQLSASISGGSVSERIVNDLQARDRWIEAMRETAAFFNDHPPFEITFDPNLTQEGETDIARRTAILRMAVALDASGAGFAALNAVLEGLESSGRRNAWGFAPWPFLDVQPAAAGTKVFNGKRDFTFTLEALLLNERGKQVGKGSVTLKSGEIPFQAGDTRIAPPAGQLGIIRFTNVKVDDLTPALTIVINSVNRIPSRTLSDTGYMRIVAGDLTERAARAAEAERAKRPAEEYITTGRFGVDEAGQTEQRRARQAEAGPAIVAVLPFAGKETDMALRFHEETIRIVAGLEKYTPREVQISTLNSAGIEIPTDMPPNRNLTPGALYALTGGVYPGSKAREYYLQLWLWDMTGSFMIYTDDLVYEDMTAVLQSLPGLVEWLFSHIIEVY